jgi:hypothetical protein
MMSNGETFRGKEQVYSFVKTSFAAANAGTPDVING